MQVGDKLFDHLRRFLLIQYIWVQEPIDVIYHWWQKLIPAFINVSSIPVTPLQSTGPPQSSASWLGFQLLPWHDFQVFPNISAFPLYHTPLPPQSSCSMLSLSTLWERNHSSVYVQSTSISAVWYALPRVSLVNSSKVDSHITVHILLKRHTSVMTIWHVMMHFYK